MQAKKWWLVALVTSLFFSVVSPVFAYYKSPVDLRGDGYIRFGDRDNPPTQPNGISIMVDESSISHTLVNIAVAMWPGLIKQRKIDKFLLIANGKIVEEFWPLKVEDEETGEFIDSGFYIVKPSIAELIGTRSYFQVVAVQIEGDGQYAVAWSNVTPEIQMKPLPVKDEEAISVLYAILEKLKEILAKLAEIIPLLQKMLDMLQKISKQIETMFTPSPAAAARLEEAAKNLFEKTPIDDIQKQMDKTKDMFTNTPTNRPLSELTFGEKRDWFGTGRSHYLIDLTDWKEYLKVMRALMDAAVWVLFFLFLIRYLQPKLDI
ncbi:hypothetical protein NDK47_27545 (plasmid) [Brevibacillus ruminantium]|uniref:Uncharacterized protein n=1 Tax=Brevibacillus ruminantium TaxID=2950604 RepID=A0ABY4WN92_9BACL|nr:hypothetical protein [Brevibacillus ruminantium]USG68557.1 hypothetical protein NDK47_27545 [Brevibacillus ruminantium]